MSETRSYVGVTGFMNRIEVETVLSLMPDTSNRMLMVGVLASTTTLGGGRPSRMFGRYPSVDKITDIFVAHPLALNFVHFNDKTRSDREILNQLVALTHFAGKKLHGFQLNIKWPNPTIFKAYKIMFPDMKFVLQVGSGAFKEVSRSPVEMAKRVERYRDLADYVLIDPSGGTGSEFDIEMTRQCLQELSRLEMDITLGVAGGLSEEALPKLVAPLVEKYPNLCIDAEGNLRDKDTDTMSLDKARRYIDLANRIFNN